MELYDSTIALSAHNWIAMHRDKGASVSEIYEGICRYYAATSVEVSTGQLDRCLVRLIAMKLLKVEPGGSHGPERFDVTDARRRPITRGREDIAASPRNPDLGWHGWCYYSREAARAAAVLVTREPIPR